MGQYYMIAAVNKNGKPIAYKRSYSMDFGAKLMEHSYFNTFVQVAIDYLLAHPKSRLVWGGDYADDTLKVYDKEEHKFIECNTYDKIYYLKEYNKIKELPNIDGESNWRARKDKFYILNHTKRQAIYIEQKDDWDIHPLPLLVCEGNGRGGGDYWGTNMKYVGSWCKNLLSISPTLPKGYKLLNIQFKEKEYKRY